MAVDPTAEKPKAVEQQTQFIVHAESAMVQLQSKHPLELNWHDTFIPFAMLDVVYLKMLEARIAAQMATPSGVRLM